MVEVSLCSVYRTTCMHSHYIMANTLMANVNKVDFGDYVISPVVIANIVRKVRYTCVIPFTIVICVAIFTIPRCSEETTNITCEEYYKLAPMHTQISDL